MKSPAPVRAPGQTPAQTPGQTPAQTPGQAPAQTPDQHPAQGSNPAPDRSQALGRSQAQQPASLLGSRQVQHEVLDALATCRNHRAWFAGFARPYLGTDPIEVGSGLGDYALEWLGDVDTFTATEADPQMLARLEAATADLPNLKVRQLALPTAERSDHSCAIGYNVLEHIADDVSALRSMARLVRPGGHVVLVCPAFQFAMSQVDIATGHVRRYSRASMRQALTAAGLDVVSVRYANSLGLACYYCVTSLLGRAPAAGPAMTCYDALAVPVIRAIERFVSPPFGQSVVAVARTPGLRRD